MQQVPLHLPLALHYRYLHAYRLQWEAARAFAKNLEDKEVILTLKVGEVGRTFGSVSTKEISEAAKKQLNLDIEKKKLVLPNPIRNLGVTNVPVKLHPKVTGSLKVWVKEEA